MADEYPKTLPLKDGTTVTLRPMEAGDVDRVATFYKALTPGDLYFLREDLTRPEILARWASDTGNNEVFALLAERDGQIVGQVSLHRNRPAWSSHVAEIQIVVSPTVRGQGLGALLVQEIFVTAVQSGIDKILAEMTFEQREARRVFEHLGFRAEGLLTNYVQDPSNRRHDIVIMAHDVDDYLRRVEVFGVQEDVDGE
ncbi:MAG TPA: GNAT family N-acetyltransferase [Dehalococcoidia bacterium]|nr:GNAT family N-acetyltransferase [Dehalococcoidia bacterium]